jgi:hypothetical protein
MIKIIMDRELVNVINYIQSIKENNYKIHKPKLIDGRQIAGLSQRGSDTQPKAYVRLMQKQRQLLYHHDLKAIEQSKEREHDHKIKITLKGTTSVMEPTPLDPISVSVNDFRRPWTKIPSNLKIQAVLQFIDHLVPPVVGDQKNQLKFLLISSVSQKKLSKQTDVEYDSNIGYLLRVCRLSYVDSRFILTDDVSNFPFTVTPPEPTPTPTPPTLPASEHQKKKFLLKIKS